MNARIDVRELLPLISVPTLVLARGGDRVISVHHARYVADRIPDATYLELPGEDHLPFVGDAVPILTAIARALGVDDDLSIDIPDAQPPPGELPDLAVGQRCPLVSVKCCGGLPAGSRMPRSRPRCTSPSRPFGSIFRTPIRSSTCESHRGRRSVERHGIQGLARRHAKIRGIANRREARALRR